MVRRMNRNDVTLILLLIGFAAVFMGLGRMEFHNELEREVLDGAFLGYLDETVYDGVVAVEPEQFPDWCQALGAAESQTVHFAEQRSGRIGLYADVVYYENRFERRTWFSGRLLDRQAEYYYKLDGAIQLKPVYTPETAEMDVMELRPVDYDYTQFRGNLVADSV